MKFFSMQEVESRFAGNISPDMWTVVIPAAGRGSRLGYSKPKILYPIAGRPILDWLIDLLKPNCQNFIFVLSLDGVSQVRPFLEKQLSGRYEVAIQDKPRGMADAVYQGVPKISTPYTLVIWGDQVAIQSRTLQDVMKIQQYDTGAKLSFPIVRRNDPYIHYETDARGRLACVLEKREGALMPAIGESDCGLFAFDTGKLQEIFQLEMDRGIAYSRVTKEWNLLPMFPFFDDADGVRLLRLESLEETIGVNDMDDVKVVENYLSRYGELL